MRPADHHDLTDWQDNAPPLTKRRMAWAVAKGGMFCLLCFLSGVYFGRLVIWLVEALAR